LDPFGPPWSLRKHLFCNHNERAHLFFFSSSFSSTTAPFAPFVGLSSVMKGMMTTLKGFFPPFLLLMVSNFLGFGKFFGGKRFSFQRGKSRRREEEKKKKATKIPFLDFVCEVFFPFLGCLVIVWRCLGKKKKKKERKKEKRKANLFPARMFLFVIAGVAVACCLPGIALFYVYRKLPALKFRQYQSLFFTNIILLLSGVLASISLQFYLSSSSLWSATCVPFLAVNICVATPWAGVVIFPFSPSLFSLLARAVPLIVL